MALGATALAASLALSACGSRGESGSSGGSGGSGGSGSGSTKTVKIGVIAPVSGDLSALGLGIQHSVELAAKKANDSGAVSGWKFEVVTKDDEAKPDVAKNAATSIAADKDVIGVVGTLNSSTSQSVQPVLSTAKIVQVSPANTNPSLTRGAKFKDAPQRMYPTYFRTCTTDSVQGPFAAKYLLEQGIKEVATIHDKKTYGQGLAEAFSEEFTKGGGKVVAAETINPDDSNYGPVISKIKPSGPKAIYYGGEYPQAGPLSKQAKAAGLNVPIMGGDGIFAADFIKLAGTTATGDLATSVGAPTDSLEKGKTFLADYKAAGYAEPSEAYGAYSYDAANAIIEAAKTALKDAKTVEDARAKMSEALGKVSIDGVTGKVEFDEYGDTKTRILTAYKVEGGKWVPAKTGSA
ncbi:branched-chain amino acid ABC transporter substrate-binding protein [Arsenicicoccus sp. oral taxon 190]|uniref:branched-chain amino acid ABC transporter substrate-binding protein n=1 Tax=Arsenicicoccus sp. oral taxon 190 TaxID=1658671 RepID=UPI0009E52DE3|nr:branched-chain amino acid ABC transporter substrate-binding protein [Arsenicicoccus sp. oral taxon 190]